MWLRNRSSCDECHCRLLTSPISLLLIVAFLFSSCRSSFPLFAHSQPSYFFSPPISLPSLLSPIFPSSSLSPPSPPSAAPFLPPSLSNKTIITTTTTNNDVGYNRKINNNYTNNFILHYFTNPAIAIHYLLFTPPISVRFTVALFLSPFTLSLPLNLLTSVSYFPPLFSTILPSPSLPPPCLPSNTFTSSSFSAVTRPL